MIAPSKKKTPVASSCRWRASTPRPYPRPPCFGSRTGTRCAPTRWSGLADHDRASAVGQLHELLGPAGHELRHRAAARRVRLRAVEIVDEHVPAAREARVEELEP